MLRASPRRASALALAAALLLPAASRAQQTCVEVAFAPGKAETYIFGIAHPESVVCYRMEAAPGLTYALRVVNGRNIIIAVPGVRDGVDAMTFTAEQPVYEIRVTQLMRSLNSEPFRIRVRKGAGSDIADAAPGAGPAARTGEIVGSMGAERRAETERALEAVKRLDFDDVLAACEREFKEIMADRGGLWKLNLDPRSFAYVNKRRIHIQIHPPGPQGHMVVLNTLVRGRSVRGGFGTACMNCYGYFQNGRLGPHMTEAGPLGAPCPGGAVPAAAPAAPPPPAAAPGGDTAALRAKVRRYVAAWLRSSRLRGPAPALDVAFEDLNGDGVPEALAILRGGTTCGARGCSAFVLDLRGAHARSIGDFIAATLRPLATRTRGWRDLAVDGRRVVFRNGRY